MSPKEAKSLESWVALSREMVELAEADEWDELAKRESVRQQQIRSFFQDTITADEAGRVKESIKQVLAMDKAVQQLAEQARDTSARELAELRRSSKAVEAYSAQSKNLPGKG